MGHVSTSSFRPRTPTGIDSCKSCACHLSLCDFIFAFMMLIYGLDLLVPPFLSDCYTFITPLHRGSVNHVGEGSNRYLRVQFPSVAPILKNVWLCFFVFVSH